MRRFLVCLAWLALALAARPAFALQPPEPTGPPSPSVLTKGTCVSGCPVVVPASPVIIGGAQICRIRLRTPPHEVLERTPTAITATSLTCDIREPIRSGEFDLTLTNDGALYSTTSALLTFDCPADTFGVDCLVCQCQELEFCNDGWDGDGLCSECSDGLYNPYCTQPCPGGVGAQQCNGNGVCDDGPSGTGACACTDSQSWGNACQTACSSDCLDSQCQQADGTCLACPPGRTGAMCENLVSVPALPGVWGPALLVLSLLGAGVLARSRRSRRAG